MSKPIKMQFGGIKDHADIVGCVPSCSTSDFLGDWYAEFSTGVGAGQMAEYQVEFIATQIGAAHWNASFYAGTDDFFFGDATTTIR